MTNKMKYLKSFRENLDRGIFNGSQREPYLESIDPNIGYERYKIYDSEAVKRDSTAILRYVDRQSYSDKILPFDNIKCLEDDKSVVFIENHPTNKTVIITSYKAIDGKQILQQGELDFTENCMPPILFMVAISDPYQAIIEGDELKESKMINPDEDIQIALDLNFSFLKALYDLDYIDDNKLMPEPVDIV